MTVTIVGAQLGDEGKGGAVDLFGEPADVVVRYQGGDNAGHTVAVGDEEFELSLLPSGVVRGTTVVLGNGCVVNPATLFDELDALRERGLDPDVRVARRAHVVFPFHRFLDSVEESAKDDDVTVGTTGRGIGPTYEDRAGRRGLRVVDLLDRDRLRDSLASLVPQKRALAEEVLGVDVDAVLDAGEWRPAADGLTDPFDVDALVERYAAFGDRLADAGMAVDAGAYLHRRVEAGDDVLMEGAQGTIIDVDHGNYPFVTSSNPTAGGAVTGTGLAPGVVGDGEVVGVVKSYLTRVGNGPMPTELAGVEGQTPGYDPAESDPRAEALATTIREAGGEYGTVTGRPRRVGWLDVPMLRHATRVNGFTGLVVGHVDVLARLDEVRVGHRYTLDGEPLDSLPASADRWSDCAVEYRTFDGWPDVDWDAVADEGFAAIPETARAFLEYLERELATPIYAVGVGPGREQTVVRDAPFAGSGAERDGSE